MKNLKNNIECVPDEDYFAVVHCPDLIEMNLLQIPVVRFPLHHFLIGMRH